MKVSRDLNNCQNGDEMLFDFLTNLFACYSFPSIENANISKTVR